MHKNDKDGSFRATNDGGNSFYNLTPTEAAHMRSLHEAETAKSNEAPSDESTPTATASDATHTTQHTGLISRTGEVLV